ncbi:MAG: hypothetical protein ACRDG7_19310 [Candidatus Limnocylindria bacterium]
MVEAQCTGTAEATAQNVEDREALAFIANCGRAAALTAAEKAQPPERRGNVTVRLRVDPLSGSLQTDYDYEKPA